MSTLDQKLVHKETLLDKISYFLRKTFPKNGSVDEGIILNAVEKKYNEYATDPLFEAFSEQYKVRIQDMNKQVHQLHPLEFYSYAQENADILYLKSFTHVDDHIKRQFKLYKRRL